MDLLDAGSPLRRRPNRWGRAFGTAAINIYEFDLKTRKWLPLHATSKRAGVISSRPYLIAIDQMKGLSVGGVTTEDAIKKSNEDLGDGSALVDEEMTHAKRIHISD